MNVYEQLQVLHTRLEGIGAHDDTMDLVEGLLHKAEPARDDRTNTTQNNVLRHILRMREVSDNYNIYNDLQELIGERDDAESATREREDSTLAAYVDTDRRPKPKSFYKTQKDKEKAEKANKKKNA